MKRINVECNIDFKDSWWLYRKDIIDYIANYKKFLMLRDEKYQEYCKKYLNYE